MLIEFRVKNFRSFKDEQVLSMVASSDKESLPNNVVEAGKLRLLKTAAIYGANASGKSNLIWALYVMQRMVKESANSGAMVWPKSMAPFLLGKGFEKEPISFEVIFIYKDIKYQYGFSVITPSMWILEEWLIAYPEGNPQRWIDRRFNLKNNKTQWNPTRKLKGKIKSLQEKTRDNSLFLSVANQWNNEQLKLVYEWFDNEIQVIPDGAKIKPITTKMLVDSSDLPTVKVSFKNFLLSFLESADIGIDDIITHTIIPTYDFPEGFSSESRAQIINDNTKTQIETIHKIRSGDKSVKFDFNDESNGTQRLYDLAGPMLMAVSSGITLVMDEIDTSLHPLITRDLVGFFQSTRTNTKGAQLIFTTHDTTLLYKDLLRRDQIWFTEKDEFCESHLYPLSDYKPRNTESLQKGYLSGRYGAIPIIKAFGIE
jgi:AAA15 family ATPase/GTPase